MKGMFITFEGAEGSGKSTQINYLYKYLMKKKKDVVFLREPGGVKISEKIRNILLDVRNTGMSNECETLLYMAARSQLIEEKIEGSLKKGEIVLCDRFLDSTIAYQGYGNGVDIRTIKRIGRFATKNIEPDLTLFFDIDAKEGIRRIAGRKKDRIEKRTIAYHNKVRGGFLALAKSEPKRIKVVKVDKTKEEIKAIVEKYINRLLKIK